MQSQNSEPVSLLMDLMDVETEIAMNIYAQSYVPLLLPWIYGILYGIFVWPNTVWRDTVEGQILSAWDVVVLKYLGSFEITRILNFPV